MYREPAPRPKTNVCNTCHGEFLVADTIITPTGTWACRNCDAAMRSRIASVTMQSGLTTATGGTPAPAGGNNRALYIALRVGAVFVLIGIKACLAFHR